VTSSAGDPVEAELGIRAASPHDRDRLRVEVAGGLLDQSAWFIDLWSSLNSEQARIDAERMKGLGSER
jgi:hypothetical protein